MFIAPGEVKKLNSIDICIVGSGPAGLTVARDFLGTKTKILILESGDGPNFDITEDLNKGEVKSGDGEGYLTYARPSGSGLEDTRYRAFGGSMNIWTGRIRPLDPEDFEPKTELRKWPITFTDLEPWYEEALKDFGVAGLSDYQKHTQNITRGFYPFPPSNSRGIAKKSWIKVKKNFGIDLYDEIEKSENVHCVLGATVTGITAAGHARRNKVKHITFRDHDMNDIRVVARSYVLACGGIENARLLLLSKTILTHGVAPARNNPWVGSCFMDHLLVPVGELVGPSSDSFYFTQPYRNVTETGVAYSAYLGPNAQVVKEGENNGSIALGANAGECREGWAVRRLVAEYEQLPNKKSALTLSNDKLDALGSPRVQLAWNILKEDKASILKQTFRLARAFISFGARIRLTDQFNPSSDFLKWSSYGHHHMGTTRMSLTDDTGVVDRDLRVHGTENLYIAGSSVFPTGGASNPTLTIVALSKRLAAEIKRKLI